MLWSSANIGKESNTHPDDDGTRLVRSADLEVRALGDVVEEEAKEILGLFSLVTNDVLREALVHIERLLASGGVYAY